VSDLQTWADNANMQTVPALQNRTSSDYEPWILFEEDWGIPTYVQLSPEMEVLTRDADYASNPAPYIE